MKRIRFLKEMRLLPVNHEIFTQFPNVLGSEPVKSVVKSIMENYILHGYEEPWICYLAVCDSEITGCCGFAGSPLNGEAEICYLTFPGYEGKGIATKMARQLICISEAKIFRGNIKLTAYTYPEECASTTILRKTGFQFVRIVSHKDYGVVWMWSRKAQSAIDWGCQ